MPMDPAAREIVEALKASIRTEQAVAQALHQLGETTRQEREADRRAIDALATNVAALNANIVELIQQLRIQNAIEEHTDQFHREVFERAGKVLGSRAAIIFYAVLGLGILSLFGILDPEIARNFLIRWLGGAITPAPPIPAPVIPGE